MLEQLASGRPPVTAALHQTADRSESRGMRKWRDASTVLVAARHAAGKGCDYRVLTARRNVESSFMPNSHVFPGGALDPADCGSEWERLHSALGIRLGLHDNELVSWGKLNVFRTPLNEYLPRYVSLRIAAVREAFEECGFLLCRRAGDSAPSATQLGRSMTPENTSELQKQLRDGALKFHDLCQRLQCFPDVWSLHETRNWLTPVHLPKRFDTAFFLVCLEQQPSTVMDEHEVTEIRWSTPEALLAEHYKGTLWLPPPQHYEMGKLSRFTKIEVLNEAAAKGHFRSNQCFMPVVVSLKDGFAFVLPGDELYDAATQDGSQFSEETIAELRARCKKMRRLERHEDGKDNFVETQDNVIKIHGTGSSDPMTGASKL
ncbi:hypothetical protein B566_EDAN018117 [Ephemera danica]|nr:hypothetical protein B566_EDAN018117 [Ephemera danica]